MSFRNVLLAGLLLPLPFLAAACGTQVLDGAKTEIAVEYDVESATGVKVRQVTCPRGLPVEPDREFRCRVVTRDGRAADAVLVILNENADLKLKRLVVP